VEPVHFSLTPRWWGSVKIHGEPAGIYYLNNTYVGEFKQVFALDTFTNYSDSDN
jgi:hypothetical protein